MNRIYYLSFDGMDIPPVNREDDISSHEAKSGIIETAGGYIDGYGTWSPVQSKEISVKFDLCDDDMHELDTKIERWKTLTGKKAKLYRRVATTQQWVYARLLHVEAETNWQESTRICTMSLSFEIISPSWYGQSIAAWTFDGGKDFDAGLYFDANNEYTISLSSSSPTATIRLTNRGNTSITDAIMTLSIINPIPTDLWFKGRTSDGRIKWTFDLSGYGQGSLNGGVDYTIDSGKKRCGYLNSSNYWIPRYRLINLLPGHRSMSWIEIEPGINTLTLGYDSLSESLSFGLKLDFVSKWR